MAIAALSLHGLSSSESSVPARFRSAPQHWTALAALLLDPSTNARRAAAMLVRSLAYGEQARRVVPLGPSLSATACERALSGAGFAANARQAMAASQRALCASAALENDACLTNMALDALGALAELLGIGTQPGWQPGMHLSALNAGLRRLQDGAADPPTVDDSKCLAALLALAAEPILPNSRTAPKASQPASTIPAFAAAHEFLVRADCTPLWACACVGRQFAAAHNRHAAAVAAAATSAVGAPNGTSVSMLDPLLVRDLILSGNIDDSALPTAIGPLLAHTRAPHPLGTRAAALDALASVLVCAPSALRIGSDVNRAALVASLKDALRLSRGVSATSQGDVPELAAARAALRVVAAVLAIDGDAAAIAEGTAAASVAHSSAGKSGDEDTSTRKMAYAATLARTWQNMLASLWVPLAACHRAVDMREAALEAIGGAVTDPSVARTPQWASAMLMVNGDVVQAGADSPIANQKHAVPTQAVMMSVLTCVTRIARTDASAACRSAACRAAARAVAACMSSRMAHVHRDTSSSASRTLIRVRASSEVKVASLEMQLARTIDAIACAAIGDSSAAVRIAATAAAAAIADAVRDKPHEVADARTPVDWSVVALPAEQGVPCSLNLTVSAFGDPLASLALVGLLASDALAYPACIRALDLAMGEDELRTLTLNVPKAAPKARPHAIRLLGFLLLSGAAAEMPWQSIAHEIVMNAAAGTSPGGRPSLSGRSQVATGLVASKAAWNACVALKDLHARFDGPHAAKSAQVVSHLAAAVEHAGHAKLAGHAALALASLARGAASAPTAQRDSTLSPALASAAASLARRARALDGSADDIPASVQPWLASCVLDSVVACASYAIDSRRSLSPSDDAEVGWALAAAASVDTDLNVAAMSRVTARAARHGRICVSTSEASSAHSAWSPL